MGTGGVPIVAEVAKGAGALTVGVVTRPFTFEGCKHAENAEAGINELRSRVDILIIIAGDGLLQVVDKQETSITDALHLGDDILWQAVQCILNLITVPCLFAHLEFAEIETLLRSGLPIPTLDKATPGHFSLLYQLYYDSL